MKMSTTPICPIPELLDVEMESWLVEQVATVTANVVVVTRDVVVVETGTVPEFPQEERPIAATARPATTTNLRMSLSSVPFRP